MQSITIMKAGPYELISSGNGLAYELINHGNEDGAPWSLFVQGDDASQFRQEIENMEAAHPSMPSRDVLGHMWATYWQGAE